jgi:hypothetical protein
MATHKVDKNVKIMKESFGTTCLITEAGRADKLLAQAHKARIAKIVMDRQPVDAWDI